MMKTALLAVAVSLLGVNGENWCSYQCGSTYPAQFGTENLAPGAAGLPFYRNKGFAANSTLSICDANFPVVQTLHPQPTISDDSLSTANFVAVCPDERKLKVFNAAGGLSPRFALDISGTDEIISFSSSFDYVAVMTTSTIFLYSVTSASIDGFNLKWKYSLESGAFSGMPSLGVSKLAASVGTSVLVIPFDNSALAFFVETTMENSLDYIIADADDETFYFCSGSGVVQFSSSDLTVSTANLDAPCTSLILSFDSVIVSAGSSLYSIKDSKVSLFGEYGDMINSISRNSWNEAIKGPQSLIALATDAGVMVVVERLVNRTLGEVYSQFDSPNPLTVKPTVTNMVEPVIFTNESVIAYTTKHTVRFFSPEYLDASLPSFEEASFLENPIMLSQDKVVNFMKDGTAVLFTWCKRYKFGEDTPESACPVADLPDEEEIPYWMTIAAGAGAVFTVPFVGQYLCTRMKVCGNDNDNLSGDDSDSDEDGDVDPKVGMILTPVRQD